MIKVIKTESEYQVALALLEQLVDQDPVVGSADADRLELLAILIDDYERKTGTRELPEAVPALRFRMEQLGLSQNDLIPYLGSKSKVSEVLSGKRPLSIAMIRALHSGLGIPAEVLVRASSQQANEEIDWNRFPIAEMTRRNWIASMPASGKSRSDPAAVLPNFFAPVGVGKALTALHRKSFHVRAARSMDIYALLAWNAQILRRASLRAHHRPFDPAQLSTTFLHSLAQTSLSDEGPRLAIDRLAEIGITVVVERHLPKTHLDGAAVLLEPSWPVIGLTLRHDRLDSFWFTLFHELAHVVLHLNKSQDPDAVFYDDLDVTAGEDVQEREADTFARETLVPEKAWLGSPASKVRAPSAVVHLAAQLGIHPAIVAGRVRRQYRDYRVLGDLVGLGQVRRQFLDVDWN